MCLYHNLQECVETDSALFYRLLPLVYKQFFRDLSTNHEMLNTAVANIDPAQVGGNNWLISIPNNCVWRWGWHFLLHEKSQFTNIIIGP